MVEGRVKRLGWVGAALLLVACDATHHARLDDGAGLAEGSPVIVSSVRVGQVESVRVQEGQVDVEFSIASDHEITLRADACALARRSEGGPELLVLPGTGAALEEERPIPQCEIPTPDVGNLMRSLGEGMGDMLRQLGQGLFGGGGAPGGSGGSSGGSSGGGSSGGSTLPLPFPLPSIPSPGSASGACDSIRVRIERTERVAPIPVHLPQGGQRAWIELANDRDEAMRVGALGDATFTDASGRVLSTATLPEDTDGWFMPFVIPAHARRSVSVTFTTTEPPHIDRVEVQHTAPESAPLDYCTIRTRGLATP